MSLLAVWIVLAAFVLFELVVQLVGVLVLRLGNVGQQIEVLAVLAVPQVAQLVFLVDLAALMDPAAPVVRLAVFLAVLVQLQFELGLVEASALSGL